MKYHCPYCGVSIENRPELAGDRVACSKCKGEYFEPTDPLPGVRPEKAPDLEIDQGGEPMVLAPASTGVGSSAVIGSLGTSEPFDMVMELKRRGQQALMISRNPDAASEVNVVFSDNLTRDQADDMVLKIAVQLMRHRWPDVYQLVASRLS